MAAHAQAPLHLKLFGGFELRVAGVSVIAISGKKTRALLAYLALADGRSQVREKLAGLLWSDRGDKQARDSLRQALVELRSAFSGVHPIPLAMDSELIAFDEAAVSVDALEFARLAGSHAVRELRRAATLYDGELLEGLSVRDPVFEDWLRGERQRYLGLAVAVMKKLLAVESGSGGEIGRAHV